jgi:hypothetical protein
MTQYEKIKNRTIEQVADEISRQIVVCEECPCFDEGGDCSNYEISCKENIIQWLESEVTENDK